MRKLKAKEVLELDNKLCILLRKQEKTNNKIKDLIDESCYSNSLFNFQKDNVVEYLFDPSCEMATVNLNGEIILCGNYWDFHPGCYGGVTRLLYYFMEYKGPQAFANTLCEYLRIKKQKFSFVKKQVTYDEIKSVFVIEP